MVDESVLFYKTIRGGTRPLHLTTAGNYIVLGNISEFSKRWSQKL